MNVNEYGKLPARKSLLCLFLILLSAIFFFALEGYAGSSPRYIYLIPDGYTGYVQIDFNVADAPPLPKEGKYFLIKLPSSGMLQTSSDMIYSTKLPYQRDEYFYYGTAGERRPTVRSSCGGGFTRGKVDRKEISWIFFIGTCTDFEKLKGKIFRPGGAPVIGPQHIR